MSQLKASQDRIAEEYKRYGKSLVMDSLGKEAHGSDYFGQTSSATFSEIIKIVDSWSLPKNAVLLDAGCGSGCFAFPLCEHLGAEVIGIDLSQNLIEKANEKSNTLPCRFVQGDYASLPNEIQQLDAILCIGSMYWNQSLDSTFTCWKERLKKKGKCLIFLNVCVSSLTEEEQKRAGGTRFFLEKELIDKISNYFTITQLHDGNATYIAWLLRWCRGMRLQWDRLVQEFGMEEADNMRIRFEAYLEYAKNGKTKRLIIESENND